MTETKKDPSKEKAENSPLIFSRMISVMRDVKAIGKDQKNPQQGYSFRGIDDVYFALHNILSKHGVFTIPTVLEERSEERKSKSGGILIYRILRILYRFFADDGSFISSIVIGEGMDSGDKSANKAMSAGHKYLLLQSFCIPTDEIKDSETEHHEVTEEKKTMKPAAKEKEKPTNGKPEAEQKIPPAGSEEEFMGGAKPPSKFDTAVHMTVKGERKKISYKEALEHFKTAKKFLGNADYYKVLGNEGFEKSTEIPFDNLDEIYKKMLKRYNDKRSDFD